MTCPDFTFSKEKVFSFFSPGVYPGVIMTVLLRRKISYHLLQTYLPSGLFVIVAWLSLFLPAESIPGRVTMAMTTLLTLAAMFGAVRYEPGQDSNRIMVYKNKT